MTVDDVSDVRRMYDRAPDKEHARLARHQLERDMTWRYLERYLPAGGTILDVGAATGVYTLELARRGYIVTAVDLAESQLSRCLKRARASGLDDRVACVAADARDLSTLGAGTFDAVLLMGPLYHLILERDRDLAIREAYGRLVPGGVLFSAWISRYGILGDLMKNVPSWIDKHDEVRSLITLGRDPDDRPKGGFRGYFATTSEIVPIHERAGFTTLAMTATEPAISADDESYNALRGARRNAWLDLLFELSAEPSCMAASRHLLYVGKRPLRRYP